MKEYVPLAMAAEETEKRPLNGCKEDKYFMKNLNLKDTYCQIKIELIR